MIAWISIRVPRSENRTFNNLFEHALACQTIRYAQTSNLQGNLKGNAHAIWHAFESTNQQYTTDYVSPTSIITDTNHMNNNDRTYNDTSPDYQRVTKRNQTKTITDPYYIRITGFQHPRRRWCSCHIRDQARNSWFGTGSTRGHLQHFVYPFRASPSASPYYSPIWARIGLHRN